MAITLDVNDIKPLLGTFGLGQAPSSKLPDLQNIPVPPMPLPPKPTPAQAGFSAYSADPLNQQKVMNSLTPPGQPIIPASVTARTPAPMAAVTPPSVSPISSALTPPGAAPSQGAQMASTINSLSPTDTAAPSTSTPGQIQTLAQWEAANPGKVENHMGNGQRIFQAITAGLLGAAGAVRKNNPTSTDGVNYAQGLVANDQGVDARNAAKYQTAVIQPLQDAAKLADVQSQTAYRTSQAGKDDALADAITPFTMTKAQATAINQPDLAGTQTTGRDYSKMITAAGNNNTSAANNKNTNDTKVTTTGMNNDTTLTNTDKKTSSAKEISDAKNKRLQDIADAGNKTKMLIAQDHDATSRANNENTNDHKVTNGAGGFKVPADVTKRAALANNVNENAGKVEDLLTSRPDILGSMGGRFTNVQQMIGSDDPDIHEMGVRMHNIALASNGAHGVRAQGAIQKTEDELFNNFKSGPNGVAGSLKATRDSMQTFLNDEANFQTTGQRTGGSTTTPPAQNTSANSIPASASAQLQEGVSHTFGNGQVWTKKNGTPTRLK